MGASFTLLPATNVLVSGGANTFTGNAISGNLQFFNALALMLNCSVVPTGGSPTLDVYVQHSMDNGTTWQDFVHTQFTTPAAKRFAFVSGFAAGGTAIVAAADATLAGETVNQGPFGDQLRIKYKLGLAGGESGQYTLAVWACPKGPGL